MPDSQASLVSTEQSLSIGLNASGFMDTFVIYSTFYSCEFDVFRFPFDKQRCYYCFIMFNYDSKSELRFNAKYASRPYIYDTSEWSLKLHEIHYEASIDSEFNMGLLYYNISLTRRPQFWIGLVITPTFLIGSLIIIGLFFGRGEDIVNNAVGLGLTTMMSMMVIVGILADSFAKSQNIPILGWYLIAEIIIITLAVLALMSSEVLCRFCSTVVTAACRESAESRYSTKTRNCLNSVKNFLREFLLERGKHSNVWLFALFILAHSVNLIVLFCLSLQRLVSIRNCLLTRPFRFQMEPELQHQNLVGVNWQDPRLSWNSADYGGIDHIYVNRLAVWMPEFYPCESSQVSIVSSEHSLSIGLNSSGFMNIFLIFSALYSCEFDVYRFPFEDCYYCFLISNYDARDELRLDPQFSQRPFIY
ncbi:hypothetical protein PMAYCL1PPCAC_06113, partial [Pristionchus mayeri]